MIRAFLSLALVLTTTAAGAQTRLLTLDDLYDPQKKIDFSGGALTGLSWISDTHYMWPRPGEQEQVEWVKVEAASGKSEPLFDAQKMRTAFDALPGLRADDVARLPNDRGLEMNPARNAVIVSIGDDLYYYPLGTDRAFRLTFDPYVEEEFAFSPDGRQAAFVRRNNLYVVNLEQQRQEKQLTTSGTNQILNGKLDWVYQEEIYGRGNFRAYWWSPDSSHLAFLQVDDRPVPEFTVVDHIPTRLNVEEWDYPKAGDPNPLVKLGVIPAVGGHVQWVDLAKYPAAEFLIVNVAWTPDSNRVVYQVQNREQYWLDLNVVPASGEGSKTLFRETTKAWVDANGPARWLKDGSFLWTSDRSGWKHLYRYEADGTDVRTVHESGIAQLAEFRLSKPELLQVKARDGFVMEAMLIKPVNFDPSRKYPVMQFTYGGPAASSVRDGWGGQTFMYYQLLAQNGVAVWVCDNRLASGKGAQSQWPSYKNFGELELRDVEDGVTHLKKQAWVDATRIGIDGWSFGGFMVTYALTHSTTFAMGIGGGNVTDWSLYDSIYTERFMLMPQNNPEGYAKSSPLAAAKNLHGQILLIHGAIDENVHAQNTLKFAYALQKAGKPFRLMLYEKSRHGVTDPDLVKHLRKLMLDFTIETLIQKARN